MSEMTVVEDAQVAYEGYRTFMGDVLRPWPEMDEPSREAWRAAAHAVREVMFCPPHWHVEHTAAMEPFTQCIACTREEVRELRQRRDYLLESNNRLVEERRAAEALAETRKVALERIHKGCCLTAQESRSRDDDRHCLAVCIEVSAAAIGDNSHANR